jgi:hypothetical protein
MDVDRPCFTYRLILTDKNDHLTPKTFMHGEGEEIMTYHIAYLSWEEH